MLIFFVLVPLVYPLLYAFIYTNETIHEVPTVVVDDSRSSLSREYLRKVDSSPEVSLVSYCADMEEAKLMLKDRRAYGIIYIPSSFNDDIVRGKQTQVSIFCEGERIAGICKALLTANTNVSLAMNADIKVERSANTTDRQDKITAYPIEYEDVALYNPTNGFAAFLIPAVLVLIIQQTLLLGIGLSAGTAREQNRFRDLVPINRHYNGTLRIVMGKGLSYFMVYSLVSVYTMCGSAAFQPQPNSDTRCPDSVHPALPGRLYFLCHDSIHCHPQPRNVHAAVRVHLSAAAVPLRHFVAGSRHACFLEVLLVHLPFYLRHQRLRTHQQYGSHTQ